MVPPDGVLRSGAGTDAGAGSRSRHRAAERQPSASPAGSTARHRRDRAMAGAGRGRQCLRQPAHHRRDRAPSTIRRVEAVVGWMRAKSWWAGVRRGVRNLVRWEGRCGGVPTLLELNTSRSTTTRRHCTPSAIFCVIARFARWAFFVGADATSDAVAIARLAAQVVGVQLRDVDNSSDVDENSLTVFDQSARCRPSCVRCADMPVSRWTALPSSRSPRSRRRWVREQAISWTRHRYGRVLVDPVHDASGLTSRRVTRRSTAGSSPRGALHDPVDESSFARPARRA